MLSTFISIISNFVLSYTNYNVMNKEKRVLKIPLDASVNCKKCLTKPVFLHLVVFLLVWIRILFCFLFLFFSDLMFNFFV